MHNCLKSNEYLWFNCRYTNDVIVSIFFGLDVDSFKDNANIFAQCRDQINSKDFMINLTMATVFLYPKYVSKFISSDNKSQTLWVSDFSIFSSSIDSATNLWIWWGILSRKQFKIEKKTTSKGMIFCKCWCSFKKQGNWKGKKMVLVQLAVSWIEFLY